jgi:hypothetical protein
MSRRTEKRWLISLFSVRYRPTTPAALPSFQVDILLILRESSNGRMHTSQGSVPTLKIDRNGRDLDGIDEPPFSFLSGTSAIAGFSAAKIRNQC